MVDYDVMVFMRFPVAVPNVPLTDDVIFNEGDSRISIIKLSSYHYVRYLLINKLGNSEYPSEIQLINPRKA